MSLQGLRNTSEQLWAKLLMGILIFSFVGWGAANWILGETTMNSSMVKIGSETVSLSDFEAERNRQIAQMGKEMQKQIYSDRQTRTYFNQQVLTNMATRILLEQHAANIGLVVSPTAVANIIKNSPEFWEDGAFSTDKFGAVLDINGISEKQFTETLRRQGLRETLLGSLANKIEPADFMVRALYSARYAKRKIEYSTIRFDAFSASGSPTEDNLREVYAKNPKMVPEHRTISYIIVGAKMNQPDSYDRGYEAARSIEDMLVAGDTMKDAAKKMRATHRTFEPMTIQKRTSRGAVGDPVLTDEIMKNLFAMEQGLESEIIEAKNGFVIFRIEKIDPAHAIPFGERRGELAALWRKSEQEKQAYLRANEILSTGKKLAVTTMVGRTDGAPLEVLSAAFSAELDKPQIVPGTNAFHIVKAVEDIPAAKMGAAKRKEIAAEIKNMLSRQILDDYTNFLARKYSITQNEKMMRRMFN
ncbi:MAG: SurA N-terminal domain-containing protein [Rickettsiales bacterium]|jgi:peptidyl-prolyl cis-trans isomerase D|nr:SurA N-terminal domain-containing protein [Rickettsiales bacterium]